MDDLALQWIESILKKSSKKEVVYTYEHFYKEFYEFSQQQKNDIKDYLDKQEDELSKRFLSYVNQAMDSLKVPGATIFDNTTFCSVKELLDMNIPKVEWFINGLIPKRGITYIGGDSGSLKSFLSQHIAMATVGDKKFLNTYDINSDGRPILYFDEENRLNILKERFGKLAESFSLEKKDLTGLKLIVDSQVKFDVDYKDQVSKLALDTIEKKIKEIRPQFIIFDSFIRFFQGDENFSSDVRIVFETIKRIMIENDCGAIILHHTGKTNNGSGKHNLRGSGEISASADVVLIMEHKKQYNNYVLSQEKNRVGEEMKPIKVTLDIDETRASINYDGTLEDSPSTIEEIKDTIKSWCLDDKNDKFKTKDVINFLSSKGFNNRTNIQAALSELLSDKFLKKPRKGYYEVQEFQKITQETIDDDSLFQQISGILNKHKKVSFENLQVMTATDEDELQRTLDKMKDKDVYEPVNGYYSLIK